MNYVITKAVYVNQIFKESTIFALEMFVVMVMIVVRMDFVILILNTVDVNGAIVEVFMANVLLKAATLI